jgi:signal transduction histidine kinase
VRVTSSHPEEAGARRHPDEADGQAEPWLHGLVAADAAVRPDCAPGPASTPDDDLGAGPADRWAELAWVLLWLLCLVAIVTVPRWEPITFYLIWFGLAVLYGYRNWPMRGTLWLLAMVAVSTATAIGLDVLRGLEPSESLSKVPLVAGLFWALAWHAHRRLTAEAERARISEENARLLTTQRRFLQDASHQLRTPITIALGHAELLARDLAGQISERDITVVVGELNRLRSLSERLLLIAASENPDFLRPEPVALDQFTMEVLRRWRPAAQRRWQLGPLEHVMVSADRERLRLALDALLENAVQHTAEGQGIRLSVTSDAGPALASLSVEDAGPGIAPDELAHIFDRFATGSGADGHRGTGLGLSLVLAIIRGHGGEVRVHSAPGEGSRFEMFLPVQIPPVDGPPGAAPGLFAPALPGTRPEPAEPLEIGTPAAGPLVAGSAAPLPAPVGCGTQAGHLPGRPRISGPRRPRVRRHSGSHGQ